VVSPAPEIACAPALRPGSLSSIARSGILIAAVFLAYAAVWRAGFVWDDDSHLTANPCIIGPLGLKEIWTSPSANYFPLVLTNFWLQHALWGLHPLGYHLINVAFHAANALLLWRVLTVLNVRGAWWGAAIWALHPVMVESVAWISELKNTQSAFFYLLAILLYLRWYTEPRGRTRRLCYVLLLVTAMAAVLSKPSTVMLPIVLLLCRWWQERRWRLNQVLPVLPLFGLSASAALWTIWEQKYHSFALGPEWNQSFVERVAIAGKSFWFYLEKLAWPFPLTFVYPRWSGASAVDLVPTFFAVAAIAFLWVRRNAFPGMLATVLSFGALLFPVLGFFSVYYFRYSFVADHFQYLASMVPLAAVPAAVLQVSVSRWPGVHAQRWVLGIVLLLGLLTTTLLQSRRFANSRQLWLTTVADNPGCWLGETILGNMANAEGRFDEAIQRHQRALRVEPRSYEAHYNLGLAFVNKGRIGDGIAEYREALRLRPDYAEAEHNLGVAFAKADQPAEAVSHYEQALRLGPPRAETELMLALALTLSNQAATAIAHYEAALKLNPTDPRARYSYGRTLEILGQTAQAIPQYRAAIQLDPRNADAEAHLAAALARTGDASGAVEHYGQAARLQPMVPGLRADYAAVLFASGRLNDAAREYEMAVRLQPTFAEARYNLGITLRRLGREPEAAAHLREARRLRPDLPVPAAR
jgi:tetratricopeptide (TPR) repeat protein